MKLKKGILKYTETLAVIAIWMAVFVAPLFMFQVNDEIEWEHVYNAWKGVLPFFILFLINHLLLVPFFLFRNKKFAYLIAGMSLVIVFSASMVFLEDSRQERHPQTEMNPPPPFIRPDHQKPPDRMPPPAQRERGPFRFPPLINTFIVGVLVIGFDTGLRMMARWSRLEQEKTVIEKENVQNQLAFLRNQVSPHFFMNTLNNIHALIDVNTEEAKESIIKLSKLMRHLLYDSQAEFVPMKKELEFIKSYIKLMGLRFSEKVKITLEIPEDLPDKTIPPLLFTSFVENAFKHGISYQNSSFVNIEFLFDAGYLTMEIRNSNPGGQGSSEDSGIGIENSRKRLDIIYGSNYTLDIQDNEEEFILFLKIPV